MNRNLYISGIYIRTGVFEWAERKSSEDIAYHKECHYKNYYMKVKASYISYPDETGMDDEWREVLTITKGGYKLFKDHFAVGKGIKAGEDIVRKYEKE